jgi:cytochrome c oxidase cbb3-type subunit 3
MRWTAPTAVFVITLTGCWREKREVRPEPGQVVVYSNAAPESLISPGGTRNVSQVNNPVDGNAYAISEGQRLFGWYNCTGCHANGGGAIGPPLIKETWIYGGESANIFDSIVKGRPNGMPTWGTKIPEYQIWQIVAYIRSLNGLQPKSATAARLDVIQKDPGTIINKVPGITK